MDCLFSFLVLLIVCCRFSNQEALFDSRTGQFIENYLSEKLTEFQLGLHNEFHLQRVNRAAPSGIPYRSVISSDVDSVNLGITEPLSIVRFEVLRTEEFQFIILATSDCALSVYGSTNDNPLTFKKIFTKENLDGAVVDITAIQAGKDFFVVFAVETIPGSNRLYVYEFSYNGFIFHHAIDCDGVVLAKISLGYSSGNLFLISTVRQDLVRGIEDFYLEVYHWRSHHFDPVSNKHKNQIITSGVQDLVVWNYYGELRFAILQLSVGNARKEMKLSEVRVYSIVAGSRRAYHGSHFRVDFDQVIALDYAASHVIYYFNSVQNLAITSADTTKNNVFFIYTTLMKSSDFVFNNLQSPVYDGTSTVIYSIPHLYPDDVLAVFDSSTNNVAVFNQDIRMRFNLHHRLGIPGEVVAIKALLISQKNNTAEVLLLLLQEPRNKQFAYVMTIDVKPLNKSTDVLAQCIKDLGNSLDSRKNYTDYLEQSIDGVFVVDKDQNVTATTIVDGATEVKEVSTVRNVFVHPRSRKLPPVTNRAILDELRKTAENFVQFTEDFDSVVFKSSNQTIVGPLMFVNDLDVVHLEAIGIPNDATFNERKFSQLSESALRIVGDQTIHEVLNVLRMKVNENLLLPSQLNGKDAQQLVLTGGNVTLSGNYTVEKPDFENLEVGTVNDLQPDDLVLATGSQDVAGLKTLHEVKVYNINVTGDVNEYDLSAFAREAVTLSENHTIAGKYAIGGLHVGGNIHLEGLISNEVDVSDLAENAVLKSTDQQIEGFIVFDDIFDVNENISATKFNGVQTSELITLDTNQEISGDLVFKENFEVKNVEAEVVNKIPVENWVHRNQPGRTVSARKIFDTSVDIGENIVLEDLVEIDRVDPSALNSSVLPTGHRVEIHGATSFKHLQVRDNLIVQDLINRHNISEINDIFWTKASVQDVPASVTTSPHVQFRGDVTTGNGVNGKDLDNDYVHAFGNESINGTIKLLNDVHAINVDVAPSVRISGYDISTLPENAVFKDGPAQKIFGRIEVLMNLVVLDGDVAVESTVNGYRISEDFLDIGSEQKVLCNVHFIYPFIRMKYLTSVSINMVSEGTINDLNLFNYVKTIVFVKDNETAIEGKTFNKIVTDVGLENSTINEININEFREDVVTLSTNQTIGGRKRITGHVQFKRTVLQFLNGKSFTDYATSVINKTADTVVTGVKTVHGSLQTNGTLQLQSQNTVNKIDLPQFSENAMVRDKFQDVSGSIWFNDDMEIKNLNVVDATVDGVNPNDVVLITAQDQTVGSTLEFTDSITVNGSLLVEGLVQTCDLYLLYVNRVTIIADSTQILHGSNFAEELVLRGPGDIILLPTREVNQVDVSELAIEVVTKSGTQSGNGSFTMNNLHVLNFTIADLINERNLSFLENDAIFRSENQVVESAKQFLKPVVLSNTSVVSILKVGSTVNDVDLEQLSNESIFKMSNESVMGKKAFADVVAENLSVSGSLNGIRLPDDVWLKTTSGLLPGNTTFSARLSTTPVIVGEDLEVMGLVDGKNLSELVENGATLSTQQTIKPHLVFEDNVFVTGDCEIGDVNGVDPDSVVKTAGEFNIDGNKVFNNAIQVDGNVQVEMINDVDIVNLSRVAVEFDTPSVLTGNSIFSSNAAFKPGANIENEVNGIHIKDSTARYYELKKEIRRKLGDLLDLQEYHMKTKDNFESSMMGQTVIPSHMKKAGHYGAMVSQLYTPMNSHTYDTVVNPVELYGLVPGTMCSHGCACQRTCFYDIDGPSLSLKSCYAGILFTVCDGDDCFTVESPEIASSEACPNDVHTGMLKCGSTVIGIPAPRITDVTLIRTETGVFVIAAAPNDGTTEFQSFVYFKDISESIFTSKPSLEGSSGASQLTTVKENLNGTVVNFLVAVNNRSIMFYRLHESNYSFVLEQTFECACSKGRLPKGIPTGLTTIINTAGEVLVIMSASLIKPGFLLEEYGPNLLVFKFADGRFKLIQEIHTGSIYHMSIMTYAGDKYIVASQTDNDKVVLFKLEGNLLKESGISIPVTEPTSTTPVFKMSSNSSIGVTNYDNNELFLFITTPKEVVVLESVQYGNGINIVAASSL